MSFFSLRWRRASAPDDRSIASLLTEGFVAIDLETTGLDPRRDVVVELAAVPFVGGRSGQAYVTPVNPERPIPPDSVRVHGVTDAMVAGAPTISAVLERLGEVSGRHVLVGHGLAFDLAILARERRAHGLGPLTNPAIDTLRLAAALHPEWERFDLDAVASRMGIGVLGRHTAEGDARASGEILVSLIPEIPTRGARTISEVIWLQETVSRIG